MFVFYVLLKCVRYRVFARRGVLHKFWCGMILTDIVLVIRNCFKNEIRILEIIMNLLHEIVHFICDCLIFTFFYVNRKKDWFHANFRFSVFDGFTRFGMP